MNILMVTLGFVPAYAWGGTVNTVYHASKELLRRGHSVTVYCSNLLSKQGIIQKGTFERYVDGIRVVYFDTWRLPWWPGTLGPAWLPDLRAWLKREIDNFDLIHINGYRNLMFLSVPKIANEHQVPFVVQPHGALAVIVNTLMIKQAYDKLLGEKELRGMRALVALQESERQLALERGIPKEKIVIIPNGIENHAQGKESVSPHFREKYNIPSESQLILFVGRINKKKGVDMLIEAFRLLDNPHTYLAIIGPDDGQLAEVKALIERYQLKERVVLTGLLTGEEVMDAYRDANLYVHPCRSDNFPMTMVEACRSGIPMVVTDRCEIAHLVKDRIAEVTPFDAEDFSNSIKRLLANQDLYERYRANCPVVMKASFSIEASVDRLEALYERVLKK